MTHKKARTATRFFDLLFDLVDRSLVPPPVDCEYFLCANPDEDSRESKTGGAVGVAVGVGCVEVRERDRTREMNRTSTNNRPHKLT